MEFEALEADLVNHPIEGYLHTGHRLNVPLISHITDNLYVGGCVNGVDLGDYFSHIFSLYKWERYTYDAANTRLYEYKMYDTAKSPIDLDTLDIVVPKVVEALDAGGNVLVHCQAGINRSNLIATLALMKFKGCPAEYAIATLREKRSPLVLSNPLFERYLMGLDSEATVL